MVGYVSFEFDEQEGKKLTLIHGEVLDGKGNFTIENFQNKAVPTKQQIDYICREGRNKYHPTKTYMGFRYVKVEADFEIDPAAFRAVAVYSDIRTTAEFSVAYRSESVISKCTLVYEGTLRCTDGLSDT
ncbi:MAG: family 78 glycoside hydrolase catalytic domain [Blautia obeum]